MFKPDYFIGPVSIHMYSVTMFLAVVVGFFLVRALAPRFGIKVSQAENLVLINFFSGFIGARIHHIITAWDYYSQNILAIFQVWQGGLGIYGGIILAVLASFVYSRIKKISFLTITDLLSPAVAVGIAIGRWGNFFNQEAYGAPTNLPWKIFIDFEYRFSGFKNFEFFHPTFLYESLWAFVVFVVLLKLIKSKDAPKFSGFVFANFLVLYPLGRYFIEGLRADKTIMFGFALNQAISLFLISIGVFLILWTVRSRRLAQGLPD